MTLSNSVCRLVRNLGVRGTVGNWRGCLYWRLFALSLQLVDSRVGNRGIGCYVLGSRRLACRWSLVLSSDGFDRRDYRFNLVSERVTSYHGVTHTSCL